MHWKGIALALLTVILGGLAKIPLEQKQTQSLREQKILEVPLQLSLRDEVGQSFFIATLGGFRSLVATMIELEAMTAWQQNNYGVVDARYAVCNKLQPREPRYWETRAWHAGTNATSAYELSGELSSAMLSLRLQRQVEKAISILREAVQYIDNDWNLWMRLADYSSNPRVNENPDYRGAAYYWERCAASYDAPRYTHRRAALMIAHIPGREQEAWDKLLALWNAPNDVHREPVIATELALLLPKIKIINPTADLPPEIAAQADKLLEKRARSERLLRRRVPIIDTMRLPHPSGR